VRIGDGPIAGRVAHLTLRTTRIETISDGLLVIPNKDVTGTRLYNLSYPPGAVMRLAISVAVDTDLERLRDLLASVSKNQTSQVLLTGLGDAATTVELVVPVTNFGDTRTLRAALVEEVARTLRGAGIKFTDIKAAT